MTDVAKLSYQIEASSVRAAERDLNKMADAAGRVEQSQKTAGTSSEKMSEKLARTHQQTEKLTGSTQILVNTLGRLAFAFGAALSIRALQNYADAWSDMQSQVGAAIKNMEAAPAMMKRMVDIANASYSPLNQTVDIYTRNVAVLRDMGMGASKAADFTEALNHSLVITATKGDRAASVQNALAKAMSIGRLTGYDLNTVLANGGRVAESLAKELNTNVNGLRQMAAEGKITSQVIANALLKSLEDVRKEAGEMPATIGDAFTRIQTNLTALIGTLDKASGVSAAIADKLLGFADSIRAAGDYILAFGHMVAPVFGALNEGLDAVAQYADYALVALAGFAVPYLIGGIATLTGGVWLLVTSLTSGLAGALKTITILLQANPLFRLGTLLPAAAVAVYHFRDDIAKAIGVDVVGIAKGAANLVIGSFVAAYEDIKFVWSNFGDIIGAQFVGGVNIAIEAMNKLGGVMQSWMNKAIQTTNRITGSKINNVSVSPFEKLANPYAERLKTAMAGRNAAVSAALSKDYIGAIGAAWDSAMSRARSGGGALDDTGGGVPPSSAVGTGAAVEQAKNDIERANALLDKLRTKWSNANRSMAESMMILPEAARALQDALRAVEEEGASAIAELAKMDNLAPEVYAQKLEEINAAIEAQKAKVEELHAAQEKLNASWEYGADKALMKYLDGVRNVAESTEKMVTRAFTGMEDALVSFVKNGKLSFSSLADSIVADITRMIVRAQITGPLGNMVMGMGGSGGLLSYAIGSIGNLFGGVQAPAPVSMGGFTPVGRASGGSVSSGSMYRVNEKGPELLNYGGKDYLMMGGKGGYVKPVEEGKTESRPVIINNNFTLNQPADRRTQQQIASMAGASIQRAMARNN